MGVPLVSLLSEKNEVWVTSRSVRAAQGNVHYIQGDAQSRDFLLSQLRIRRYDAVIDFMVRSKENLESVLTEILRATNQYIFISSARVYAQSEAPITENTPRLLDISTDEEFLRTEEYSLAKAREEDLIINHGLKNWTIIRPSVTYNDYRLQLGAFEKEGWLYRALHGRSIVFSEDLAGKITTMTSGNDVARGIAAIVGDHRAFGEVFQITSPKSLLWRDVLSIYLEVLENYLNAHVKVCWTKETVYWQFPEQIYRLKYCRLYNRRFDNRKVGQFIDTDSFASPEQGLKDSLTHFLKQPKFQHMDWRLEGIHDRLSGENTPLDEIPSLTGKITYLAYRYKIKFILPVMRIAKMIKQKTRITNYA